MKGKKAMTNTERQAEFRENLALKNAKRLSITISQEAADALQVIRNWRKEFEYPHTKRAAIEAALIDYAFILSDE